ncbi:hypothetical protein ACF0H5_014746 [Mactra antiquata]
MASSSVSLEKEETTASTTDENMYENMDEEINHLTSSFDGQVRVMDAVKSDIFIRTVKINPNNSNIVFNFNLKNSYPSSVPEVTVRCDDLDEDDLFDLKTYLQQSANTLSHRSLEQLVKIGLTWLKEQDIDMSGKKKTNAQQGLKGKSKNKQKKSKTKEDKEKGKKPPMKTSMDVVKRILWDSALQQDQFLVGYMDRIDGLKEKYFNAFSWEDIASVDYTVLAIPKHRIQYFKYKNEIVWDKRCRLDNVFGSTGSKITISDVINKIDGVKVNNDDDDASSIVNDVEQVQEEPDSDYYDDDDCSDSSDSDSDDGIEVTINNGDINGAVGGLTYDDEDMVEEGEEDRYDKYWRDKLRPNHFIALRITDAEIRDAAETIQNQVIENEQRLENCKINRGALHLTLCTMGLETPEQVENAVKCLEEAVSELKSIMPNDKPLTFKGVETFFNRVIYGRVVDCPPEFYELVEHLKTCLSVGGIDIRDYHEFVPHMTIMKVSRPVAKMTGNHYIAPWLYSSFNETVLGHQLVDNLHLCAMTDDRQDDGFYKTAVSFQW